MAKIKRGVSFYSYQQAQFFGMRWKDMVKELHDNLHCDGVEIINESTIPRYPFGTEEFFYDWDETMARYNMVPTVSNVFFDTLQFRDHVMSYEEGINRLKYDIRTAARMGFHMVRCLGSLPFEIYKGAVPEAEKYDVQIGRELHVPEGMYSPLAEELIEYVDKTGCPYLKIVVDMSCFEIATPQPNIDYAIRNADEDDKKMIEYIENNKPDMSNDELVACMEKDLGFGADKTFWIMHSFGHKIPSAQPEDILHVVPYMMSMHGKFYDMTEIPGEPGHYEDKSIMYKEVIDILKTTDWEGYIDSEFEGQRSRQDMGREGLVDEVDQVRKHHEMLKRLIGEE